MKTILHTEASNGLGGQEFRTLHEIAYFREKGYRVLLACQPGSHILRLANEKKFPVYIIKMRSSIDPLAIRSFCRLIKKESVDIVHTHSSLDSWTAGLAARLTGVAKIVRTRHVSIPVSNKMVYTQLADKIITTGETIRHHIHERCSIDLQHIVSIPTGIDLKRFTPGNVNHKPLFRELGLPKDCLLIGILGMIRWCKGISVFLQSAKLLRDEFPKARFVIVGFDPDHVIDMQKEIEQEGLETCVHYLGFREDLPEILASLDILVSASTAAEGVSQAIVQGLAMGKAVVGTRIGGTPEVILHNQTGLLIEPNDAKALAETLADLMLSEETRKTLGEKGAEFVRDRFEINQMMNRIEEVYQ